MKTHSTLLLFCMAFCLFNADAQLCRTDTVYRYDFDKFTNVNSLISRTIYHFNDKNQMINNKTQHWDKTNGVFIEMSNVDYILNSAGLLLDLIVSNRNLTTNQMEFFNRFLQQFDDSNNVIDYLLQTWNTSTASWENYSRIQFEYNSLNLDTNRISLSWNKNAKAWDNYTRVQRTYNTAGKNTSFVLSFWRNNQWTFEKRTVNLFNMQNLIIDETNYQYDTTAANWKIISSAETTYDSGNKRIKLNNYVYPAQIKQNSNQIFYDYNAQGLAEERIQMWYPHHNNYINNTRYLSSYNLKNLLTIKLHETWDTISNSWTSANRTQNIYLYDTLLQETKEENFKKGNWVTQMRTTSEFDLNGKKTAYDYYNTWEESINNFALHAREEYKCAIKNVSLDDINSKNFSLTAYPNPSSDIFTIQSNLQCTFYLYDQNGKLIQTGSLEQGNTQINLSNYQAGLYWLRSEYGSVCLVVGR